MADTAFNGFTTVTALQAGDIGLFQRSGGGVNITAANLFRSVLDGTAGAPGLAFGGDTNTGLFRPTADVLGFSTGGVERMRIDAAGNVGIGKSAPATRLVVKATTNATTDYPASIENLADSLTVGFGAYGMSNRVSVSQTSNYSFDIGGNCVFLAGGVERLRLTGSNGVVAPGADNAQSNGWSSGRWSVIYAVTGTINTSDEREKLWIGVREDSRAVWLRIARRIFDQLGFYQWHAAVADKGEDNARWHFGARAQRVWAIVADEGLCAPLVDGVPDPDWDGPPAPAFLCFDQWEEETEERPLFSPSILNQNGEPIQTGVETIVTQAAGNRFGFRPDQLGLLLDWSLHQRLSALEAA